MASFEFKNKPIPNKFLGVDDITPEYECTPCGDRLSGIWVYIGGTAHYFECDRYTLCDPVEASEGGRRQAMDLAIELTNMSNVVKKDLFGLKSVREIFLQFSYEDITKKLDTWKKEKETIRVRDEVYSEAYEMRFVITKIWTPSGNEDAYVNGLKKDGTAIKGLLLRNLKKTGLHVDDLDSYLEV